MRNRYLIPYFGDMFVSSITYAELQRIANWRVNKLRREPNASALNTHNSALNRAFNEAVARGYMSQTQVPMLVSRGKGSKRRDGKSRDMRHLLRD